MTFKRMRWRRLTFRLRESAFVSPQIGQALADDAFGGDFGAAHVGQFAGVVAGVELHEVAG